MGTFVVFTLVILVLQYLVSGPPEDEATGMARVITAVAIGAVCAFIS